MLAKLRRLKAKRTIDPICDEGQVFIQFFDKPDTFYPEEGGGNSDIGLDMRIVEQHGGIEKYFEEIELIQTVDNEYFQRRKVIIEGDIEELEDHVRDLQTEIASLRGLLTLEG